MTRETKEPDCRLLWQRGAQNFVSTCWGEAAFQLQWGAECGATRGSPVGEERFSRAAGLGLRTVPNRVCLAARTQGGSTVLHFPGLRWPLVGALPAAHDLPAPAMWQGHVLWV